MTSSIDNVSPPHSGDDDYETRLWKAFGRLTLGNSENDELMQKAKDGRPEANITNVAKEAGCSRTLIGHNGCSHQNVRDAILAVSGRKLVQNRGEETVASLVEAIVELEARQQSRREVYAELIDRTKAFSRKLVPNVTPISAPADIESVLTLFNINEPVKRKVAWLRKQIATLKFDVAQHDSEYANLILRARAYESGTTLGGAPLKRATKAEKRRALSIVGSSS